MSGQLGELLGETLMHASARAQVIATLAALPVTRQLRRQLLIEWARKVRTTLEPGELDRVSAARGIP